MPSSRTRSRPRSEAQKQRRQELWLARQDDRRNIADRANRERYDELKAAMARVGIAIGPIADIDEKFDDPIKRYETLKARVERWDALWSITLRKRDTRGKIIIGGAILAELDETTRDEPDNALISTILDIVDRRVLKIRDRLIVRELLDLAGDANYPLPLRPGGPVGESLDDALRAVKEQHIPLETEHEEGEDDSAIGL